MILFESTSFFLLQISNALLLAAACIAVLRFEQRVRKSESFWASPTGSLISGKKLAGANIDDIESADLHRQMDALQQEIKHLTNAKANAGTTSSRELLIENAINMVKSGATPEQLARTCGLNIGEAQLLKKLHVLPDLSTTPSQGRA